MTRSGHTGEEEIAFGSRIEPANEERAVDENTMTAPSTDAARDLEEALAPLTPEQRRAVRLLVRQEIGRIEAERRALNVGR